jgi:hypothetical protein
MTIKSQKDFASGLIFVLIGVAFAWGATAHDLGTGARMGPGFFPLALGIILAVLGSTVTFKSLLSSSGEDDGVGKFAWKPLVFIIAANLVFGVLLGGLPSIGLPSMGLIVAIYALTFISAFAGNEFRFKEVLVLATVLSVLSYVTFVLLLKVQFPVWPTFIIG